MCGYNRHTRVERETPKPKPAPLPVPHREREEAAKGKKATGKLATTGI